MPSSKLSPRRYTAGTPPICRTKPKPPPVVCPFTWPTSIPVHWVATVRRPGGKPPIQIIWMYTCYRAEMFTYYGQGYTPPGLLSSTVIPFRSGLCPTEFDVLVQYTVPYYGGQVAEAYHRPILYPQPHRYDYPPWDLLPGPTTLDGFITF